MQIQRSFLRAFIAGTAGIVGLLLGANIARAQDKIPLSAHFELGPAFTAFVGGGAEEVGAGFAGSFSLLYELDEDVFIGPRIGYSQSYYTKIEDVVGQELRARFISGGVEGEAGPAEWPARFFAYATWGAVALKIDTTNLLLAPVRYKQTDFFSDLGGGVRFFPSDHVNIALEANIASTWGTSADWAAWNFRLGAMLGVRY